VDDSGFQALFAVFFLVAIAIAVGGYLARRRRIEALHALALEHGLEYRDDDEVGILGLPFALFDKGDGRGIENVVSGEWHGMPLHGFDYWYYDETTDSKGHRHRTTYRFTCALTELDARCPRLSIAEESVFSRLADMLSFRDIEFESEEFNRAFDVRGDDRAFAHAVVDARMMTWLLERGRGFDIELSGSSALIACGRMAPAGWPGVWATLRDFRAQVPRAVYSLYPKSG
jgi:hypothetical protein